MTDKLEAGPEMDALVAEKVMGWKVHFRNTAHWMRVDDDRVDYKPVAWVNDWHPSTSIAAAWEVVEKINRMWSMHWLPEAEVWSVCFLDEVGINACEAPTAPLAICRAALKAVEKS